MDSFGFNSSFYSPGIRKEKRRLNKRNMHLSPEHRLHLHTCVIDATGRSLIVTYVKCKSCT